jgi:hypothetical protein
MLSKDFIEWLAVAPLPAYFYCIACIVQIGEIDDRMKGKLISR